jgi:hypothetical protein
LPAVATALLFVLGGQIKRLSPAPVGVK